MLALIYWIGVIATLILLIIIVRAILKNEDEPMPRWVLPIILIVPFLTWLAFILTLVVLWDDVLSEPWGEWWCKPLFGSKKVK